MFRCLNALLGPPMKSKLEAPGQFDRNANRKWPFCESAYAGSTPMQKNCSFIVTLISHRERAILATSRRGCQPRKSEKCKADAPVPEGPWRCRQPATAKGSQVTRDLSSSARRKLAEKGTIRIQRDCSREPGWLRTDQRRLEADSMLPRAVNRFVPADQAARSTLLSAR